MRRGVVFGGGGLVGMAYHAGVLKALEDRGLDLAGADVVVGTSAGAVMASYLAVGWAMSDFWEYGHGRHPTSRAHPEEQTEDIRTLFEPLWTSRADRVRRSVGSLFAVAASRGLLRAGTRGRIPAAYLRRAFPSGMYSTERTRLRLHAELPRAWPREHLYICAADLYTGERVPFGHVSAPQVPLPDAVLASTAIPGVFPPVKIDGRAYVDGGIVSATSLDLAVHSGCDTVLCIAPLGFRRQPTDNTRDPRVWGPMFVRGLFARQVRTEVREARERGVDVFVIRPWFADLARHGTNSMRMFDRAGMMENAHEGTLRLLDQYEGHPAIEAARTTKSEQAG